MSYELIGKLIAKYDTVQRKETFKTREFVIEKSTWEILLRYYSISRVLSGTRTARIIILPI